ncbi:MAG: radical SAM protein [Candidatus Aminicenantes bacterium]|nr:radical SAM protein [Candidatus Aminicenantes bacterium]
MKTTTQPKRILLSAVFGPYGVDDAYGRKENIMELFHNQVTKAQGIGSFRFHHRSFGLYFLAANIDADVTVLDFPSRQRFIREIKKGYDIVGISFIMPNFIKAKEMARLVRLHAPQAKIVLGGHGTAIEGIETLIDCDEVAKGEGIRWLRTYLGQDPEAPIYHPTLRSAQYMRIFGVPLFGKSASLLVPGLGCVNGCKFCSTSHFFGRTYTPYLATGQELFETACRIADETGSDDFFVMDENFLKDRTRAMELLQEMEAHQRFFDFSIFSSAEAIQAFGVENLARLGVKFLWLGVETKNQAENFEKNRGLDPQRLIRQLRDHGVSVLASGILCMEHHTPDNIQIDIDHLVGMESDLVQFMLLIPIPVTELYRDLQKRGLLKMDLPFEDWHGQKRLNFNHPMFPGDAAEHWIKAAFRKDYEENSSSMYRLIETSFRGARTLAAKSETGESDPWLAARAEQLRKRTLDYAPILAAIERHAVNERERRRALDLERKIEVAFGPRTIVARLGRAASILLAAAWKLRLRVVGDGIQPRTIVTRYAAASKARAGRTADIVSLRPAAGDSEAPRMSAAARISTNL